MCFERKFTNTLGERKIPTVLRMICSEFVKAHK